MFRAVKGTVAVAGACSVLACSATTFNASWKAPDAQPINFAGQKVLALVVSPNEGNRRAAEEALARELTARGVQGVPGYTVLPTEVVQSKDRETGRSMVEKSGVVGVVSMRLVSKDKEITSTPGMWTLTCCRVRLIESRAKGLEEPPPSQKPERLFALPF